MTVFSQKLNEVERHGIKNHSIFSEVRTNERLKRFENEESKIILAWGQDPCIKKLAEHALHLVPKDQQVFGLQFSYRKWAYRHPYPKIQNRCIAWLKEMKEQLSRLKNGKSFFQ